MGADLPDRSTYRALLASGLEARLVTTKCYAQAVYAYQASDFAGQSPVVVVTSAGTEAEQSTFGGDETRFDYDVIVFVLYADGTAWTEADSEGRIDLLEKEVRDWVADNRAGTIYWHTRGQTEIDAVMVGGDEYRMERIPISALIP